MVGSLSLSKFIRILVLIFALSSTFVLFQNFAPIGIIGRIDGITISGGQPLVVGWACDHGQNKSINIHMYLGGPAGIGVYGGAHRAISHSEAAVSQQCGTSGVAHRFYFPLSNSIIKNHAGKKIYIHGLSVSGGKNFVLARSGEFAVPKTSNLIIDGWIDHIQFKLEKSKTAGTLDRVIRGWACDVGTSKSIDVHVYSGAPAGRGGATYIKKAKANIDAGSNSGVANRCGFKNGAHRFEITLTEAEVNAHAGRALYIHGISQSKPSLNGLIGQSGVIRLPQKRVTVSGSAAAIQKALDNAFESEGGIVQVKAGNYTLTNYFHIRSNTALISDAKTRYIRSSSANMLRNQKNDAKGYNGYGNIAIIGGVWDGNTVSYPQSFATFALGYAENLIVRGVTLLDVGPGGHAIDLASSKNVLIEDSSFLGYVPTAAGDVKEAIQLDHNIPHNPLSVASFAFGVRDGTPNVNVTIRNNRFGTNKDSKDKKVRAWPTGVGGHGAVHDKYQNNIVVKNNIFEGMTYAGVRVFKWNNATIEENKFIGCEMAVRTTAAYAGTSSAMNAERTKAYNISQAGKNLTIRNNTILNSVGTAIGIYGANDGSIDDSALWKNVTITGNSFLNNKGNHVSFNRTYNIKVLENALENVPTDKYGVYVTSTSKGSIKNNSIQGGRKNGVTVTSSCSNVVVGANKWIAR